MLSVAESPAVKGVVNSLAYYDLAIVVLTREREKRAGVTQNATQMQWGLQNSTRGIKACRAPCRLSYTLVGYLTEGTESV